MSYPIGKTVLEEVFRINAELRALGRRKVRSKTSYNKPVAFWIEKEPVRFGEKLEVLDALVVILGTRGCRWAWQGRGGGCIFCGYVYKNPRGGGNLLRQVNYVINKTSDKLNDIGVIKIFTSGSFMDEFEVTDSERLEILSKLVEAFPNLKVLQLETRPEHIVNRAKLDPLKRFDVDIYFNVGLESANDQVLELINKGFLFNTYIKALERAKEYGFYLKTYLMLKQPFQTEWEAILDVIESGRKVMDLGTKTISINPMVIYSYTFVEFLWNNGLYRPPWLHSVLYTVRELLKYENSHDKVILSDPVAPGSKRGAHTCSNSCDRELNEALERMVLEQNPNVEIPECCKDAWEMYIQEENVKRDLSYASVLP